MIVQITHEEENTSDNEEDEKGNLRFESDLRDLLIDHGSEPSRGYGERESGN
jgi:hypothetical protein